MMMISTDEDDQLSFRSSLAVVEVKIVLCQTSMAKYSKAGIDDDGGDDEDGEPNLARFSFSRFPSGCKAAKSIWEIVLRVIEIGRENFRIV